MSLLGELTYALISSPQTDIGGLIPDVVVEEVYRDSLIITDHPVEQGAAITDHAFKRPSGIDIRAGWSNSTAGAEGYIDGVYSAMLALQASRQPFTVFTPRRMYRNMLAADIVVSRDERTNSVLACTLSLREIIIANTQPSRSAPGAQAMPEKTASPVDRGTVTPQPTSPAQASFPPGGA
ncbi:phage baseplate protein [Methylobacterium ajmalii]|jgi:hypothetical protein|uniref:phage baseplate protein n=1 Tax=Methylobacterium ajmalii TaxID=2738439 RepID=UPI00190E0074|nr:hypothetical protein [Methylobacterium ajmalii]MBK3400823.1 hypothetical protein [Methylobacterium ajmalii]MBK3412265.1 hypothetical protein [Methylobacterium ajmalii]MBK3426894.1 hypothetical protein [Methylobacterium ajmalii]MBZ6416921.1 hypothetical protein [Methylobacterium sp.]